MTLSYLETFKRNGHEEDGTRDTEGRLVCTKCGIPCSTEQANIVCPKADYVHIEVMNREIQLIVNEFGKVKSGKRLAKKVSKLYGKEMKKAAKEKTDELYKSFEEHIKPRPKWMPVWLWRWIGGKFVEGL